MYIRRGKATDYKLPVHAFLSLNSLISRLGMKESLLIMVMRIALVCGQLMMVAGMILNVINSQHTYVRSQ